MEINVERFWGHVINSQSGKKVKEELKKDHKKYIAQLFEEVKEISNYLNTTLIALDEEHKNYSNLLIIAKQLAKNLGELKKQKVVWVSYFWPAVYVRNVIDSFPFLFNQEQPPK